MKRFENKLGWFAVAFFLVSILFSFTSNAPDEEEFVAGSSIYENTFTADTITDAENDTLAISPALISNWFYNWTLRVTQATGTKNVIFILQESNERSGDSWYEVERDTATGSGETIVRLYGSGLSGRVSGVRQRVILDGSGTQSSTYVVKATLKKDN